MDDRFRNILWRGDRASYHDGVRASLRRTRCRYHFLFGTTSRQSTTALRTGAKNIITRTRSEIQRGVNERTLGGVACPSQCGIIFPWTRRPLDGVPKK